MVPKIESTASRNSFIFLPIPRDSRLTDGVLNGSSCSDSVFLAFNLGFEGPFPGTFVLRSEPRVENAETDIDVNLGTSSIPRRGASRRSGVGFWDRARVNQGVILSGK